MTITYRKRENFFEKGEHEWRVEDDALIWHRPDGSEMRYPWSEATHIRASFAPTRMKMWRHVVRMDFRRGTPVVIDNVHFQGLANFENRSASYVPFVRAAVERIASAAPGAHGHLGANAWSYYLQLAFVVAVFSLLALVLLTLPVPFTDFYILRFVIIAAMLPVLFVWIRRARPRGVPLDPEAFAGGLPKV